MIPASAKMLSKLTLPTLFIVGSHDLTCRVATLESHVPDNCAVHVVEGADHNLRLSEAHLKVQSQEDADKVRGACGGARVRCATLTPPRPQAVVAAIKAFAHKAAAAPAAARAKRVAAQEEREEEAEAEKAEAKAAKAKAESTPAKRARNKAAAY